MKNIKKVPNHLRKAGNIHKLIEWEKKQEIKELKNNEEKYQAIEYLKGKYTFGGLAYADPRNWSNEDQKLFINIWVMDGYSESQIKRMYKIYPLKNPNALLDAIREGRAI